MAISIQNIIAVCLLIFVVVAVITMALIVQADSFVAAVMWLNVVVFVVGAVLLFVRKPNAN